MEFDSFVYERNIYFNLNSQKNEKNRFFSREAYDFQILQNETMVIAVYQDIKFSFFTR